MAWRRPGDNPSSEPVMVSLLTHLGITRPQWVNVQTIWERESNHCLDTVCHTSKLAKYFHNRSVTIGLCAFRELHDFYQGSKIKLVRITCWYRREHFSKYVYEDPHMWKIITVQYDLVIFMSRSINQYHFALELYRCYVNETQECVKFQSSMRKGCCKIHCRIFFQCNNKITKTKKGPIFLTWHMHMRWNYLSIPKLQWLYRWSLGMDG